MLQQYEKSNQEKGKHPRNGGFGPGVRRRESQNDECEAVPENKSNLGQEDWGRGLWENIGQGKRRYDGDRGKPKDKIQAEMQEKGKIIRNDRKKTIIKNNQDHSHVSNLGNWVTGAWPSSLTPILIRVGVGAQVWGFHP